MRDKYRIKPFCDELRDIWEEYCPDWRFGQLICNVFGEMKTDPFFLEEKEMMEHFKQFFKIEEGEDK